MRIIVAGIVTLLLPCGLAAADPLNEKIVKFSKENLGKTVGDGECAALAVEALKATGGQARSKLKDNPNDGDYVWGKLVYTLEYKNGKQVETVEKGFRVQPGDIIQYRDVKFQGKTPNGGTYQASASHHTSVIVGVSKNGRVWNILEQNSNNKRFVVENNLILNDFRGGWMRVYRPQPKD